MSIRTNPMKAVPTLLKRLVTVEKHANLNDLKYELIKIKDLFSMVKKNEEELLDTLTVVDGYIRNKNIRKLMEEKEDICQKIRNSTQKFGFKLTTWRVVFNVGASYLNFAPQRMAKMKHMEVLQLGRWLQDSPKHHIEVDSEDFLKELRDQKHLKYLSLRGISRIFELPPSIVQLENLETLDLKSCQNLETLPNDISSLRKLRHLDLSRCYLLDRMPKGIEKLTELRELKGLVLGSSSKTPFRISDLANLEKLERLSIHIGNGAVIQDTEFESLKEFSALEHLKISWGVFDTRYSDIQISLPSSLEKLHFEGFPGQEIPEWLKPSELPRGLKVLNITGGKLKSMKHGEDNNHWRAKIVRLKYLKHLTVDLTDLQELFPLLRYAEIKQILNHSYFEWSID